MLIVVSFDSLVRVQIYELFLKQTNYYVEKCCKKQGVVFRLWNLMDENQKVRKKLGGFIKMY
jgi:hypothetical protein